MMNLSQFQFRSYDPRVPALREELRSHVPMGATTAPLEALVVAMALQIAELSARVDDLEARLGAR